MRYFSAVPALQGRGRPRGLLTIVLAVVALHGEGQAADPPGTSAQDRAQIAYQESLKLYKAGQYRAAVDKLVEARKLDPTAKELPYNLGLLYEKLGEIDNAIKNFQLYLTLDTDEEEKERVRSILQRLEGARDELNRNKPTSAPEPPPPPPRRRGRLDALVYGTGGLSLAAVGAGVFFGLRALSLRPEPSTVGQRIETLEDKQRKAHQSGVIADISFGVAIASGGAAALLYFLRDAPPPKEGAPAAFVAPTPGGGVVGWGGRF
jgi:tetratricopeptide (TPR) repeat protein